MSEQGPGEKTFAPTPKRRRDAAKKGDVLRSREVATAAAIAAGGVALYAGGPLLLSAIRHVALAGFRFGRSSIDDFSGGMLFSEALTSVVPPILAIGLIVMITTTVSQLALGEGRFLPSNLLPKPSRINPLSGLKRMFGAQGLIELGKSLLKLLLLGTIGFWWARKNLADLLGLGRGELSTQLSFAFDAVGTLFILLAFGLLIIATVDYPIQFIRRMGRLKMTHQEMRDETKQSEGSPEMRSARRQRQRDMARSGLMKAMDDAQFVITNPAHFAVAMAYDSTLAPAPVVIAKGRDEKALAMREIAAEKAIPVLEYPQLARAVYFTTREHQVIREELYIAIASLVAFVFALGRGEAVRRPQIEVPSDLRFDSHGRAAKP